MDISSMKNMVVLKNLPSNIVDEAFVVLKSNKKVKKLEKVEKIKRKGEEKDEKDKEYVLKEAEMLVTDYISKIENNKKDTLNKAKDNLKKYKMCAYIATIIAFFEAIVIIYS